MIRLDPALRSVFRNGQHHRLQFKTWQVLCQLLDARPATVSRATLIREIWNGQDFTGEKGLNQSLWAIRHALGDKARAPAFVETVPRAGYRWIGPELDREPTLDDVARHARPIFRPSAALAAGCALLLAIAAGQTGPDGTGANRFVTENGSARAWFSGRDIIVERPAAPQYILRPSGAKYFASPAFSEDGGKLAFQVINDQRCETVVLELTSRRIDRFANCASAGWSLERIFGT